MPVLQIAVAVVLASVLLGFTFVKNVNYALAELRATSAVSSLDGGELEMALQSINGAIAPASDVGKYHVIRAKNLNQVRASITNNSERNQLAIEAYEANGRAVASNPFDLFGRLHFAESALTLSMLGRSKKGD